MSISYFYLFFTLQLVIEKYLSEIGVNGSIQTRSLHEPIKYAQNTTQCHTHCFFLSIGPLPGTNMYLIRLMTELLRERSMAQQKPPQTAKALEGIYVLDGNLMSTTFTCQSKINIHMLHIYEAFSYEHFPKYVCYTFIIPYVCLYVGDKDLLYTSGQP